MIKEDNILTYKQIAKIDPTKTTLLRNRFSSDMNKRFTELALMVKRSVYNNDCFGLKGLQANQMQPTTEEEFKYKTSSEKIAFFLLWLQEQVDRGVLNTSLFENPWTNKYVYEAYKRGVIRARQELIKAGYKIPTIEAMGGIDVVLQNIYHVERLGLLQGKVFTDLKGITDAMSTQISRILTQGFLNGEDPALLARKLVATINGTGMGELGITDTLGRFIPASRRAMMLARSETIRAYGESALLEFKNWGLENVTALAEFSTVGDDKVCSKCSHLQGVVYSLDEASGIIPVHPNCFIDPQIPIYTSEGWKPIGKIQIGDLVLTHKRRFRKVYALPRTKAIIGETEVVTFKFAGKWHLSMTSNHPVLWTTKNGKYPRWVDAGKIREGDCLSFLGNVCKRCGKSIPFFRTYCSHTCLSLDVTEKQWANPEHRKNMSEKTSAQLKREYNSGVRNGNDITKAANEKTRLMVLEGTHPFQQPGAIAKMIVNTHTPELNKRHSERMKKNNPMKDPMIVLKAQEAIQRHLLENPEKRINARMAKYRKSGNKTWIEERMGLLLDKLGVEYVFQYPILRYNVDFAIPELMIAIECDGEQWHQDKEKEQIRQERIEHEGWTVLHYTGAKINQCLPEIEKELARVLCNHLGEFNLASWPVESIKKWNMQSTRTLYNLSVEEDESYIAKGVVVHNCRCFWLPAIKELQKYK